ncbi:alpha-galactosidase [Paenibacillus rhizosphaerae]|uniref:Alpha-galactosidase n=1 Tax=Paenibacillus rhizosphaerae TaxID=297318 RepID=A0A1R1F4C6_9BACL|nr:MULTISPECIES: glycoside hydrolase family 27 protein [Paenibacillus]OMF58964.1 alpha-galactosidase [Paenibacillus rhizosphaerae]UYO04087.1 glycoside hydrolase family 27 protein [Paenibacillus sp. PSB04]
MQHHSFAPTPPMGWNSWDCYGATVTEAEVRGNAEYMARHLKDYGWEYIVVDIQWYEPGAVSDLYRPFVRLETDGYSRLIPAVNRFPSAEGGQGFKPLADYVHSLGLKFGIHIMRGIPRQAVHDNTPIKGTNVTARDIAHTCSFCGWNTDMYGVDAGKKGAQEYYHSLFELYAEWGVDYVKVDDIADSWLHGGPHLAEIELIRKAIDHAGRPMVLSLSPGPAPVKHADFLETHANMWRMTDDFWDRWPLLLDMFDRCETWQGRPKPGCWPDCDMLPLGRIGVRCSHPDRMTNFTRDEQLTMMTLWTIFRSPLMFGGEMRDNDEWTLSLLTNRDVLDMHQHSFGARQVSRSEGRVIWAAEGPHGERYAALFNTGEEAAEVSVSLAELGISGSAHARNLWTGEERRELGGTLASAVPPHGASLFRLIAE